MASDFKTIPIIDISPLLDKCDDPNMEEDPGVQEVVQLLDQACKEAGFFYVLLPWNFELTGNAGEIWSQRKEEPANYYLAVSSFILNKIASTWFLMYLVPCIKGCCSFIQAFDFHPHGGETLTGIRGARKRGATPKTSKGHGISDSLVKQVKDVTCRFFELPYDEKVKVKMSPATGFRGYQRIGENITKDKPDMHEAIDCYREVRPGMYGVLGKTMEGTNLWPEYPSNFKGIMEEYVSLLQDLSRKIMRGIALALGGPADTFEGERAGDPFWVMRLIGYPGSSDAKNDQMQDNEIGCGAHTDYGILTLVNQDDDITALQVRNKSGEWINAVPVPGTFVCNIGDMLKVLTNGIYEPTLHRVINKSSKYRTSVAFFYEPNFDVPIGPLDFCRQRTGGIARFDKVIYGEHLVNKVLTNFVI